MKSLRSVADGQSRNMARKTSWDMELVTGEFTPVSVTEFVIWSCVCRNGEQWRHCKPCRVGCHGEVRDAASVTHTICSQAVYRFPSDGVDMFTMNSLDALTDLRFRYLRCCRTILEDAIARGPHSHSISRCFSFSSLQALFPYHRCSTMTLSPSQKSLRLISPDTTLS